jgi:hypothetical protein
VMDTRQARHGHASNQTWASAIVNESTSYHLFGIAMQASPTSNAPSVPAWLVCRRRRHSKRYGLGMVRPGGGGLSPLLADGYLKRRPTA